MYLAQMLDLEFKFTWPGFRQDSTYHVLPGVPEQVFSPSFLNTYYLEESQVSPPGSFDIRNPLHVRRQTLRSNCRPQRIERLSSRGLEFFLAPLRRQGPLEQPEIFAEVIDSFKHDMFCAQVQQGLDVAYSLDIQPGTTAVHFRGGDVIHGKARYWGRFARSKSLCMPVARSLLDCVNPGRGKMLFGSSEKDLKQLRGSAACHRLATEELEAVSNTTASLLAEVVLMSRCGQLICAGGSGVTYLAQSIGHVELLAASSLLSAEEECQLIHSSLPANDGDELHRAFAAYNAFILSWESGRKENLDMYLELANRDDPENPLYPALRLLNAMREENFPAFSEAQLALGQLWAQEIQRRGFAPRYLDFIRRHKKTGTPVVSEAMAEIKARLPGKKGLKWLLELWLARLSN